MDTVLNLGFFNHLNPEIYGDNIWQCCFCLPENTAFPLQYKLINAVHENK
jgi:hypothetical protein